MQNELIRILKSVDENGKINSIASTEDDGKLYRIQSAYAHDLQTRLKHRFPLSNVAIREDVIRGGNELQLLVPNDADQHAHALRLATNDSKVVLLRMLYTLSFIVSIGFLCVCLVDVFIRMR